MVFMAKKINIQNIFFIILFLSFPLGEIARIQFKNNIAVTATDLFVFLFVFISFFKYFFKRTNPTPKLLKSICLFLLVALVSMLINVSSLKNYEIIPSFLYLIRWVIYAGVYFSVLSLDKSVKSKIPLMLTSSGAVVLLLGFAQYFLYPNLRNLIYAGWDEHLYRMFSSFLDPNFAGAFFVLYFIFLLGIISKTFKENDWIAKSSLLLLGGASAMGIFLTFSRSAYLMLGVGLLAWVFLQNKKKISLLIILFLFILGAVYLLVGPKSEGTNLLRITSTEARIPAAKTAFMIFQKNPIFGVGFNSYRYASQKYSFVGQPNNYPNHAGAGTDNSLLFILATTGVFGFLSYVFIWLRVLQIAKEKNKKDVFGSVLTVSLISLFVNTLFINSLFYTFIMLWMWTLIAYVED